MNTTNNIPEIYTGTPRSATLHTITLNEDASDQDGAYTEHVLKHIKGTGIGEQQTIKSYNGRTRVATLHGAWIITPDATSVYAIINPEPQGLETLVNLNTKPNHIGKGGRTGKHDHNGTEIYDGHILKYIDTEKYQHHDEPYLIQWDDNDAGFTCESSTNFMLACVWNQMETIGNIRDNPELMGDNQRRESDKTDFRWDRDVGNVE